MSRLTRICQTVTLAAAGFTVLWACGRPPTAPSRPAEPVTPLPAPGPQPIVRTIIGEWGGEFQTTPDSPITLASLTIEDFRGTPLGTLRIMNVPYMTDTARQEPIDVNGPFTLHFQGVPGSIALRGELGADGRHFTGRSTGPEGMQRSFVFRRR